MVSRNNVPDAGGSVPRDGITAAHSVPMGGDEAQPEIRKLTCADTRRHDPTTVLTDSSLSPLLHLYF